MINADGYCVYFYRSWLRDRESGGLMDVTKIGFSKDIKTRIWGLRQWARNNFSAIDDWPLYIVDNLTKQQAVTLETEIHDLLTFGEVNSLLPGTKEWFSITSRVRKFLVDFCVIRTGKSSKTLTPKTEILDGQDDIYTVEKVLFAKCHTS